MTLKNTKLIFSGTNTYQSGVDNKDETTQLSGYSKRVSLFYGLHYFQGK